MKKFLLFVLLGAVIAGCGGVTRETTRYIRPTNYSDAMDELGRQLVILDKNVVGGQMTLAQSGAERALTLATDVGKFDPQRAGESEADYIEYGAQTDDLRRSCDRLLYYIEHRRRDDSRDQVFKVIERYNKMSLTYGPGRQIKPIERLDNGRDVRVTKEVPGEFR
ncbi:MAG: hypothetical protein IT462_04885 [Planctomycetes bacterium]|nr:hypothetical protein [Planctomycetota bacterium]